jgi:hypothetical protein
MPDVLLFLTAAETSLEPGGFNLRSAAVGAKQAPPVPGAPSSAAKSNRLVPVLFFLSVIPVISAIASLYNSLSF